MAQQSAAECMACTNGGACLLSRLFQHMGEASKVEALKIASNAGVAPSSAAAATSAAPVAGNAPAPAAAANTAQKASPASLATLKAAQAAPRCMHVDAMYILHVLTCCGHVIRPAKISEYAQTGMVHQAVLLFDSAGAAPIYMRFVHQRSLTNQLSLSASMSAESSEDATAGDEQASARQPEGTQQQAAAAPAPPRRHSHEHVSLQQPECCRMCALQI
jgi:hypothetical protein